MHQSQDPDLLVIETDIASAMDFIADGEERRANILLDRCIQKLRLLSVGASRKEALRLWAICLCIQEEWEQSLLKYEQVLSIDPADEDSLWQSAQILLRNLEKPEAARRVLEDRLLPINRTDEYLDTLRECEAAMGIPPAGKG
ncbi:MAG: hypothetical protein IPK50_04820 [Fibrobacterota bacterium]|nr:hypothetical protein [Fibrobacterota bacterium]QQS06217.1 MAG: hypothetical protein IPK50_04820 [Fibrobacterota bacterium]